MGNSALLPVQYDEALAALEALRNDKKGLHKAAILKLHLENFSDFNNIFGYTYGDYLLSEIGAYLGGLGGKCYRLSGVEFLLVLEKTAYLDAQQLADDIAERFTGTWRVEGVDCATSVQVGVLLPPVPDENAGLLMEKLNFAVADAGERGQNQVSIYDETLAAKQAMEQAMAEKLRWCVQNDWQDVELRCRVSMNIEAGQYTRAECYARLFVDDYGFAGAERFIPVAEKVGVVCSLNLHLIDRACQLIRRLMDGGRVFESIAVPVSALLFLQQGVDQEIAAILEKNGVPAQKLALEVTESSVTANNTVNIIMQEITDLGVELILTDFGTGYSGISNMLDLPVNALKLDRMLIWELENNPRSGVIVEGLISIANKLGLKTIAEGVETDNQRQLLLDYGCPYQQGFYYAATVPMDDLAAMLPAAAR